VEQELAALKRDVNQELAALKRDVNETSKKLDTILSWMGRLTN
jgi:hypothetical protein